MDGYGLFHYIIPCPIYGVPAKEDFTIRDEMPDIVKELCNGILSGEYDLMNIMEYLKKLDPDLMASILKKKNDQGIIEDTVAIAELGDL